MAAAVLADEARVVLGDWLAGLQTRRPVITWPYLITGQGLEPLPSDTAEARLLRLERRCGTKSGRCRPGGSARQPRDRHPHADGEASRDQPSGGGGRPVRRRCPPTAPRRRTRRRHTVPRRRPGRSRGGLPSAQQRVTASRCGTALAAPAARLRHHGHGQNRQLRPRWRAGQRLTQTRRSTAESSGEPPGSIFPLRSVHDGIRPQPADQDAQHGWRRSPQPPPPTRARSPTRSGRSFSTREPLDTAR